LPLDLTLADALAHFLAAVREQDCLVALRHVVGGCQ
jgi:hypothetical protein